MQRGSVRFSPMETVIDFGIPPSSPKSPKRPFCFLSRYWLMVFFALLLIATVIFKSSTHATGDDYLSLQPGGEKFLYQSNYLKYNMSSVEYDFAIISDMDKKSLMEGGKQWRGILKSGKLKRKSTGDYEVVWISEVNKPSPNDFFSLKSQKEENLSSAYNEAGRGMELSELVYFDGKLLTCDDRTGISSVFEIITTESIVVPLFVVTVGNGKTDKGFKCEWMTVVNDKLYVGSIGKEYTVNGQIKDFGAQWIKIIDRNGKIEHVQWRSNYEALRKKSETEYPAYLWHEAIVWNPLNREWIVFPRRSSKESYDEKVDEMKGTNIFFITNEDFSRIEVKTVGPLDPLKGTSSFKLLPFREGEVAQLKTIESGDHIESFLTVVNINTGEVLMPDVSCGNIKYEGIEIL